MEKSNQEAIRQVFAQKYSNYEINGDELFVIEAFLSRVPVSRSDIDYIMGGIRLEILEYCDSLEDLTCAVDKADGKRGKLASKIRARKIAEADEKSSEKSSEFDEQLYEDSIREQIGELEEEGERCQTGQIIPRLKGEELYQYYLRFCHVVDFRKGPVPLFTLAMTKLKGVYNRLLPDKIGDQFWMIPAVIKQLQWAINFQSSEKAIKGVQFKSVDVKGSTGLNRPLVRLSQIVLFLKKFVISRYDIRSNYVGQLKEIAVQLEYPFDLKTNKNKLRANPIKIPVPCLPNNFCGRCQDKIKFIESKLSSLTYRPNATVSASQFDSKSIRRRLNSAIMVEWITRRCIRNVHQFPNLHKKKIDSVDAFCAFFFTVNSQYQSKDTQVLIDNASIIGLLQYGWQYGWGEQATFAANIRRTISANFGPIRAKLEAIRKCLHCSSVYAVLNDICNTTNKALSHLSRFVPPRGFVTPFFKFDLSAKTMNQLVPKIQLLEDVTRTAFSNAIIQESERHPSSRVCEIMRHLFQAEWVSGEPQARQPHDFILNEEDDPDILAINERIQERTKKLMSQ